MPAPTPPKLSDLAFLYDDSPASLRRLTLGLYALIAPVFVVALAIEAEPEARVPASVAVLALIAAGALLMLVQPVPGYAARIVTSEVVPVACCGIAYVATGGTGVAFMAILLAPMAMAAVLHQRAAVVTAVGVATALMVVVIPGADPATRLVNAVVFGGTAALVGVVAFGRADHLMRERAEAVTERARLKALVDALPDAIGRVDADGRFIEVRMPAGEVPPYPPDGVAGFDAMSLLPADMAPAARAALADTLADGTVREHTFQALDAARSFEVRIARSGPGEALFIRRDVTEQERARREARFAETLLATVNEAVVFMDRDRRIRTWSPGAERIYGWTAEEAVGRTIDELLWPEGDIVRLEAWWQEALVKGRSLDRGPRTAKDGREIIVDVSLVPLPGTDGQEPAGVIGVARDVTEEAALQAERAALAARVEAALAEREQILAVSPVGIAMTRARTYVWANAHLASMLGYEPHELPGLPTRATHASDDEYARIGAEGYAAISNGRTYATEIALRRKDGSSVWVRLSGRPMQAGHTAWDGASIWTFEDITERRLQMERLAEALVAREQSVAELQEALASVRTLSGMLPICMYCKKIRNDQGYWDRIEKYVAEHTDARFSHGMCPECYEEQVGAMIGPEDAARAIADDGLAEG